MFEVASSSLLPSTCVQILCFVSVPVQFRDVDVVFSNGVQ